MRMNDRVRMERAHVAAWPALHTRRVSGWLWRCSGGGSQRANSVSTVDFDGSDVETAINTVEALYRDEAAEPRFQTFDETQPDDLPALLQQRGYRPTEATITMIRPVAAGADTVYSDVGIRDAAWPEWMDVYLGAITASRRDVNRRILDAIPGPRAFFGAYRDGRMAATALCVIAHGCAVVECVATDALMRRQGAARQVMSALSGWAATQDAELIGLQVTASNEPAVNLYRSLGFHPSATNRFWIKG